MRPRLKDVVWERMGDELTLVFDQRSPLVVSDVDGRMETLLGLLRRGDHTVPELAAQLSTAGPEVSAEDVHGIVAALDGHRLVEDADRLGRYTGGVHDRHYSNLAFFETFATLERSREDLLDSARGAHVLVLGTGGLNSNTVPHLAGLGVGRLTLADRDVVESKNFARQYLYTWRDLGHSKVKAAGAWVQRFDPDIDVSTRELDVRGSEDVARLLDETRPDLVMSGIDSPRGVDLWVNEACVSRGVPFVRGGMGVSTAGVWSVVPSVSACRMCLELADPTNGELDLSPGTDDAHTDAARRLYESKPRVNRGIGALAGLLGSYAAFECLRLLTGFETPQYAGSLLTINLTDGCSTTLQEWERRPDCPACGSAATAPSALAQVVGEPSGSSAPSVDSPSSSRQPLGV
ncbi:HesA/MoeB/ThiF family protein [Knoellia sp. LjRoot47]|uniref:HesA/MoeB/ThiF family protein n=1 Tax=Knoellia sp. LjRoot47 TaxID=3342330 RepID=UPI003ECD1028